ncbi:hypothetical protein VNO80_06981 [Phaseolus coccineus]|uniref:Uncharacterized protein n=1 Tax=Phaseolus coccineus TaxID=3886 RepID=A0AAN9RI26_PHACN
MASLPSSLLSNPSSPTCSRKDNKAAFFIAEFLPPSSSPTTIVTSPSISVAATSAIVKDNKTTFFTAEIPPPSSSPTTAVTYHRRRITFHSRCRYSRFCSCLHRPRPCSRGYLMHFFRCC